MSKLTIIERDKRIAVAVQFDSLTSISRVSELTQYPEHQVRYSLNRLRDAELIKPRVLINSSRLGLSEYSITLNILHANEQSRTSLHTFFQGHSQTADVLLLGGNFDYYIMFTTSKPRDVLSFLRGAAAIPGIRIVNKNVSLRLRADFYRRRYLIDGDGDTDCISYEVGPSVDIEEFDRVILESLILQSHSSFRDLARKMRVPHTTVSSRIRRLRELGVIVGFPYGFHAQKLGISVFRIFLFVSSLSATQLESLRSFCQEHSNVVTMLETVGAWDFEIRAEVLDAEEARNVCQQIHELLGSSIIKIELLPMFRYLKGHFGQGYRAIEVRK